MLNIAVFVSGGGTNLQALIDAQSRGELQNGKITFVLASNSGAYALKRALKAPWFQEKNMIPKRLMM